jgi:hypothetical protein
VVIQAAIYLGVAGSVASAISQTVTKADAEEGYENES